MRGIFNSILIVTWAYDGSAIYIPNGQCTKLEHQGTTLVRDVLCEPAQILGWFVLYTTACLSVVKTYKSLRALCMAAQEVNCVTGPR